MQLTARNIIVAIVVMIGLWLIYEKYVKKTKKHATLMGSPLRYEQPYYEDSKLQPFNLNTHVDEMSLMDKQFSSLINSGDGFELYDVNCGMDYEIQQPCNTDHGVGCSVCNVKYDDDEEIVKHLSSPNTPRSRHTVDLIDNENESYVKALQRGDIY